MNRAIVFGSLNMDLSIACARIPQAGETIIGGDFITNPGGKGANQAVAMAKLGAPTVMIGAVGCDAFGEELARALGAYAVDTSELARTNAAPTGVAVIVRAEGDNRIIVDPGANHALDASRVAAALDRVAQPGDIFVTQLECDLDATCAALHHAHEHGLITVFNPAPAHALPDTIWRDVDVLCLNETECALIAGIMPEDDERVARAMRAFADRGVACTIITRGAAGSDVWCAGNLEHIAAVDVHAVDTTAAGDTYIGAFVAARLEGADVIEAARWATRASAIAVTRPGAQQSIPTRREMDEPTLRGDGAISAERA